MITVDSLRLARFNAELHLRRGTGEGGNGKLDMCAMQAADWLAGGLGKTDAPSCVDPAIRGFVIRLNDSPRFEEWRDELKPFIPRTLNTSVDHATSLRRVYRCADWAVRTIAPLAFEFWGEVVPARRDEALAWATKLRDVAAIVDRKTAEAARKVAREAPAYAAAAAAAAAAARSKADAFSRAMWEQSLGLLDRLIQVTEANLMAAAP